jgi:hypothetical protein
VLRVNVIGYTLGAKYAIPHMIERGGGVVINTSSASGVLGEYIRPMYGTSKAAIIGLTRNIAAEFGKQGVRAIAIAPGTILTPAARAVVPADMLDLMARHALTPRVGVPEDIGYMVAFLASEEAGFITGVTIPVDVHLALAHLRRGGRGHDCQHLTAIASGWRRLRRHLSAPFLGLRVIRSGQSSDWTCELGKCPVPAMAASMRVTSSVRMAASRVACPGLKQITKRSSESMLTSVTCRLSRMAL